MQELDGILLINKPKEYTSHDVVAKVKKILKVNKIGHTGTLDPNATGVLPLLLNKGTKFSKYLINHDKEYEVLLQLGKKTDTADAEGKIIEEKNVDIDKMGKAEEILKTFIGTQEQIPPMYSAIKVNGKKLYEYARRGEIVEIESRKIEIYNIKLLKIDIENLQVAFSVSCSKGTYIRTLCEDIASKLETVGYMKELKRTKVGEFNIEDAITIEQLEKKVELKENINIIQSKDLLKKDTIILEENEIDKYFNGVKIKRNIENDVYQIYNKKLEYLGTGIVNNNYLKRDIVI